MKIVNSVSGNIVSITDVRVNWLSQQIVIQFNYFENDAQHTRYNNGTMTAFECIQTGVYNNYTQLDVEFSAMGSSAKSIYDNMLSAGYEALLDNVYLRTDNWDYYINP